MLTEWVLKLQDKIDNGLAKLEARTQKTIGRFDKLQTKINAVENAGSKLGGVLNGALLGVASAFAVAGIGQTICR